MATRTVWANALDERARAYWTPERTHALTGGKALEILPAEAPRLLRALGLLDGDATMPPARVRKYLQINHLAKALRPAMAELRARHPTVRLVDAGCGRSYLTLLLAWIHRVEVLGVDRNADVIAECQRRAALAELDDLVRFEAAPLETIIEREAARGIHGVFALHACDTATCDAIALGVTAGADLVAVAPCCQAELARKWEALGTDDGFAAVRGMPHLRRETAAHITDAMRTLLLRSRGYTAVATEFISFEHTAKNTLIRALRGEPNPTARAEYEALVTSTGGAGLALADRI
ncbi:MAG: SAM-dependent methyltransferase [Kofleriaceae bacterium]